MYGNREDSLFESNISFLYWGMQMMRLNWSGKGTCNLERHRNKRA